MGRLPAVFFSQSGSGLSSSSVLLFPCFACLSGLARFLVAGLYKDIECISLSNKWVALVRHTVLRAAYGAQN